MILDKVSLICDNYYMINVKYEIQIYSDIRGKEPFTEWLESLENIQRYRIKARLTRLALGNFGDYKHIENEIYELRFITNSGFRLYYGIINNKIIILLNGGNKKSQLKDILKAKKYFNDYLNRKEKVLK